MIKIFAGSILALLVLSIPFATPAYAKEFHGEGEAFTLKSSGQGIIFEKGPDILCGEVVFSGIAPSSSSNTLRVTPKYTKCKREKIPVSEAEIKFGECQYELHSSETEKVLLSIIPTACKINITFSSEKECVISIPGQKGLEGATVSGKMGGTFTLSLGGVREVPWSQEHCAGLESKGKDARLKGGVTGTGVWYE